MLLSGPACTGIALFNKRQTLSEQLCPILAEDGRWAYNGPAGRRCPMATSGAAESDPRTPPPATADRLDSWKEIASYLKRSARTVTRWEREQGLPVHRHTTGTVYAYKPELDAWWTSHRQQIENEPPAAAQPRHPWWRRLRIAAAVAGLIVATGLVGFILRPHSTPQPKLVPLTTYPGIEGAPALSPDGN